MKVKLIIDGGAMKPGPAVAQQLGPMGINLGKVISDVNTATKSFAGIKVPVELDVNPKTKHYEIKVFSPPTSELIKKELTIEKGSGDHKMTSAGNISVEQLIGIAKTKMPDLLAKNTRNALKLMVGSCVSLGVLVDNKQAKDVEKEIDSGVYDKEIKSELAKPSDEKKKALAEFFTEHRAKQEKTKKALEEARLAAEAEKAAAQAAAGVVPAAGAAAPEAGAEGAKAAAPAAATAAAGAKAPAGKAEEKKETKKK